MSTSFSAQEIRKTQQQYLVIVPGAYFTTGFFWVFVSLGSVMLGQGEDQDRLSAFFYSMIVLMASNGVWEILTGWYADKFRRRLSITVGFFASVAGFLLMGVAAFIRLENVSDQTATVFGPRLLVWLAGVTVWSLGPALRSGAQEAWLVDRCNFLSEAPPEPLGAIFKTAARRGVIAKAFGSIICFSVLSLMLIYPSNDPSNDQSDARLELAFFLAGGLAAFLTGYLGYYSLRLQEEYWTDPKYQSEESLVAFLWMGIKDLWKVPYSWFTVAFIGATVLNYILSSTVWAYLGHDMKATIAVLGQPRNVIVIAVSIVFIELLAGFLSQAFSKQIDRIKQPRWRMPVAALMYLLPALPLYISFYQDVFIYVLLAAAFFFRTAHASVFGTLNTHGQLLIDSDERRAVMLSLSSALASFFTALVFIFIFIGINRSHTSISVEEGIRVSWMYITLPSIFMLAVGGYLVTREVRN